MVGRSTGCEIASGDKPRGVMEVGGGGGGAAVVQREGVNIITPTIRSGQMGIFIKVVGPF